MSRGGEVLTPVFSHKCQIMGCARNAVTPIWTAATPRESYGTKAGLPYYVRHS